MMLFDTLHASKGLLCQVACGGHVRIQNKPDEDALHKTMKCRGNHTCITIWKNLDDHLAEIARYA